MDTRPLCCWTRIILIRTLIFKAIYVHNQPGTEIIDNSSVAWLCVNIKTFIKISFSVWSYQLWSQIFICYRIYLIANIKCTFIPPSKIAQLIQMNLTAAAVLIACEHELTPQLSPDGESRKQNLSNSGCSIQLSDPQLACCMDADTQSEATGSWLYDRGCFPLSPRTLIRCLLLGPIRRIALCSWSGFHWKVLQIMKIQIGKAIRSKIDQSQEWFRWKCPENRAAALRNRDSNTPTGASKVKWRIQ